LHEHDDEGAEGGAPVAGNGEEFGEAVGTPGDGFFGFEEDVDVCGGKVLW
jgi:hypothetical protein